MTDKPLVVKGVKVNVTADDFDDVEIMELASENNIVGIIVKVFGRKTYDEIKKALYDDEAGKTRMSDVAEWLETVMTKVGAKN